MKSESTYIIAFVCILGIALTAIYAAGLKSSMAFVISMVSLAIYIVLKLTWKGFKKLLMELIEDIKAK